MKIALTGATGFLGRYILKQLLSEGRSCRCWRRPSSDLTGLHTGPEDSLEWIQGDLGDTASFPKLVRGAEAVVHTALERFQSSSFQASGSKDLEKFLQFNLMGTLSLMHIAREAGVERFIFISSCAVHDVILNDHPLNEAHPLWPMTHYGAYKAAVEKFVHSFGLGEGWKVCALRPTGIYGVAHPPEKSKWMDLIRRVRRGEPLSLMRGGKEVHAADVARAVSLLLRAEGTQGQSYNCCDRYISEAEVAKIAREALGVTCPIEDKNMGPKNQIDTKKIQSLGMTFGGEELLRETVETLTRSMTL